MTTSRTEDRPSGHARRAMIYGTGLIGGSVGMALTGRGWHVSGVDLAPSVSERAVALGAIAEVGEDHSAELVVVATPVHVAAEVVQRVISGPYGPTTVVTDVGSVKGPLVASVVHPFFVGGHPMAGSEQVGIEGAAADLFVGATWVLTPTAATDPTAYARLRAVLADIGADVVALDPDRHDSLVAVVSHVPHLTAATLMTLAADREDEHVGYLYHPLHPGILRALKQISEAATSTGKPVAMCGDMAGDPMLVWILLGLGLRNLSMAPRQIPVLKSIVRSTRLKEAEHLIAQALEMRTEVEIEALVYRVMSERFPLEVTDGEEEKMDA